MNKPCVEAQSVAFLKVTDREPALGSLQTGAFSFRLHTRKQSDTEKVTHTKRSLTHCVSESVLMWPFWLIH